MVINKFTIPDLIKDGRLKKVYGYKRKRGRFYMIADSPFVVINSPDLGGYDFRVCKFAVEWGRYDFHRIVYFLSRKSAEDFFNSATFVELKNDFAEVEFSRLREV